LKATTAIGEICKFAAFLTEGCIAPVGERLKSCYLSPINRGEREGGREIFEEIVAKTFHVWLKRKACFNISFFLTSNTIEMIEHNLKTNLHRVTTNFFPVTGEWHTIFCWSLLCSLL